MSRPRGENRFSIGYWKVIKDQYIFLSWVHFHLEVSRNGYKLTIISNVIAKPFELKSDVLGVSDP